MTSNRFYQAGMVLLVALLSPLCSRASTGVTASPVEEMCLGELRGEAMACNEILQILEAHILRPENAGGNNRDLAGLDANDAERLLFQLFCTDLPARCTPPLTTLAWQILAGHPLVAGMHEYFVAAALDRSVDYSLRLTAAKLAIANEDRSLNWMVDLLDPRHGIPIREILAGAERMEADPDLMRKTIPRLVLAAEAGPNFHERIEAGLVLLRNVDLIGTDLLVPMLLVASEGCRKTADPYRVAALEASGPRRHELADLLCPFGKRA